MSADDASRDIQILQKLLWMSKHTIPRKIGVVIEGNDHSVDAAISRYQRNLRVRMTGHNQWFTDESKPSKLPRHAIND
ncbi:MAG: hypothetical protein WA354_08135 [Terracidiphilus sp.]